MSAPTDPHEDLDWPWTEHTVEVLPDGTRIERKVWRPDPPESPHLRQLYDELRADEDDDEW
jgi:hypothetical protein